MNEHNHHKVIDAFMDAAPLPILHAIIPDFFEEYMKNDFAYRKELWFWPGSPKYNKIKNTLYEASDFADSINAEGKYYYYHFYNNISTNSDTIRLSRVDEKYLKNGLNRGGMRRCGNKVSFIRWATTSDVGVNPGLDIGLWLPEKDEKEFYSMVNGRQKSAHWDLLDIGNQSDNVAFLHAMSSYSGKNDNSKEDENAKNNFIEHLEHLFKEFLRIKEDEKALFMLGIALHGIMDSFTPSHMGFQNYLMQDMALHAQGDVVSFESEKDKVDFDPGQYSKIRWYNVAEKKFTQMKKRYSDDDVMSDIVFTPNPTQLCMLDVFMDLGHFEEFEENKSLIESIKNRSISRDLLSKKMITTKESDGLGVKSQYIEYYSLNKLRNIIKKGFKCYGSKSFLYSRFAIQSVLSVWYVMIWGRYKCCENYSEYCSKAVKCAIDCWSKVYYNEEMEEERKRHINLNLYNKSKKHTINILK